MCGESAVAIIRLNLCIVRIQLLVKPLAKFRDWLQQSSVGLRKSDDFNLVSWVP
jgi:hypothetical protein